MPDSLLSILIPWFIVSIGAVVSPGPVSAAVITEAPRQGWRVGPLVSVGHSILELIVVILLGIGLSAGMASPPIQRAIAFVGGLVLLAMGAGYVLAAGRGTMRLPAPDAAAPRQTPARLVGLGVLMTASNPFWYAWWVTVAPAYLAQAQAFGQAGLAAFYLGHISADFTWNTAVAGATHAGRRWLTDGRYRALIGLVGVFMGYLGVRFLLAALGGPSG